MHRNIHCQVIMGPIIVPAPPLTCTSSALTSRETKMPSTMPSCCSEPSTPRCLVGDISVIYIGATTEATPAANPPNTRNATRISMVRRERAADSAYQEANGGDLHHRHAADLVGDAPGQQRADAPGDQRRTDGEAKHGVAGVKMFLDDRGGAIDDGGVVTVEQSAKRGAGSKTGNDIAL